MARGIQDINRNDNEPVSEKAKRTPWPFIVVGIVLILFSFKDVFCSHNESIQLLTGIGWQDLCKDAKPVKLDKIVLYGLLGAAFIYTGVSALIKNRKKK